jgi:hypothetical protein
MSDKDNIHFGVFQSIKIKFWTSSLLVIVF